ncbi:MAG: sulfite exporter TauE/SafE family protein [Verrucomicrobiales bacterium]|nr:sulfite exporter TauE/SafE family protein [Verrucomicrobiales bacterium]
MDSTSAIIAAAAILFAASYLQSATGFGGAIFCMALLPLVIPIYDAIAFVSASSFLVLVMVIFANRSGLSLKNAGPLCIGMVIGIPIGYYSLRQLDGEFIRRTLGAILMIIAAAEFLQGRFANWKIPEKTGALFGIVGGVLAGAFNVGGPPVVAYVYSRKWSKVEMVAILQAVFIAGVIARNLLMLGAGEFTIDLIKMVAWATPAAAIAVWLGKLTLDRLPLPILKRIVFCLIFLIGLKYLTGW